MYIHIHIYVYLSYLIIFIISNYLVRYSILPIINILKDLIIVFSKITSSKSSNKILNFITLNFRTGIKV